MFGNLGDLVNLAQKAKEIQGNMAKIREEISKAEYSGISEDGRVRAVVSGDFLVKGLSFVPGAEMAPEAILADACAAVNTALQTARMDAAAKMREATGDIKLPDNLNIPGL